MNVRERAKTFEAFMSSNTDSLLPESEPKRSNGDTGEDISGSAASNGQKQPGQEKQKPVPPPRKTRKRAQSRPDSPQSLQNTPTKTSNEKQQPEKPKIPPKKPPPPRPAPYKKLSSSSSVVSHIPHAKTKELSASLSRRREASEAKQTPRPSSGGSPKTTRKAHSRESPAKPPRGSSRSSPSSSPKVSRSPSKVSSCEIHLSHDFVKEDSQEKVPKKNPQRPPPPQRTSSLKRKTKPPVPPKPKRSPKPREVLDKKAATIPRTGSVESKEVATNNSTEEALAKDVETKQRSLSTPLLTTEPRDSEVEENVHENGLEESHKVEETLELKNDNMDTAHINGIDESLKTSDIDNTEIISKESEDKSIDNSEEALSTSENVDNAIISFKDETSTTVDDSDKTFEETSLYDTEHENNGECSIDEKSAHDNEQEPSPDHSEQETSESKEVGNEIVIDEQKEQRDVDNEEQNVKDENEKHSDAKCIDHDDIENSNLSQSSALCKEEGVSEVSSEMEEDKANDNGTKDSRLNENEDVKGIFSVCEPMETNIDDIINGNNLEFATGHFENASEKVVVLSEDETPNENENVMEKATVDNTSKEQQIETINEDVSDEISSKIESSLDKEEHEDAERAIFAECDINDVQSEAIAVDETTFDDDTKDQQVEENRIDVQERPLVETDPNTHTKEGEFEEETESNVEKYLPNEQPIPEEKELVEFQNYPLVETDPNIQMPKGEFEEEPKANVEENVLNEQSLPEEKELEVENYPSVETDPNMQMNESRDVIDIESSVAEINPISPSDAKESIESEISPIPQGPPIEANRSSYLETSLDEEFFSEEELNQEVNDVVHDDEPYETEINIEVSLSTNRSVDMQEDRSILTIDDNGTTDEVETGSGRAEIQKEEPSKVEVSPERVSQYENGVISTEKDKETKEVKKEPVKPARPSRLKKKKNHTYENTSLPPTDVSGTNDEDDTSGKASPEPTGAYENTSIKVQENIESTSTGNDEDDTSGKASPELTGAYENTSIKENIESTSAGNDKPSSPKRTEVYENAVIINQTHQKQEEENREELSTLPATISVKPEKESSPRENRQPAYENVVFPSDDKFAEDDSVYQVPRRKSFHSDSPTTSLVRSTRSASVGSMERKKGGKNVMRTFKTEAESTYVVPTTRASTGTEETYAAPRDVRPSTEETYVTPKSVLTASDTNDIYAAPRPIRTSSADPEEMYATPREISAADDEETYAAPKPIRSVSETTSNSESEYHVPSSLLKEEFPSVEYKVPTSPSKNSIVAADTAAVIVTDDPFLDEELPLRRTTRSSVLTARDHARSAPPKPPRSSADMSEQPVEKPKAIPRTSLGEVQQTPEMSPKASPRPKPRKSQDHSTVEKEENELGTSEVHNDQVASSPKPKRPPPPRPKAPSFSVSGDKNTTENDSESKHKAPPRPPPPPLSRVSIISSEQDPPMDSSSESEEEEQPPAPIGPPKKKTYHIAHEILSTERTFVTALTLCCEDCYDLIKEADVVPESTLNDIFKDLGNIYHLDVKFLNELEERMKTWEEKERIGDIVRKYSYFLKMYTTYINHYDKAQNVLQETVKENIQFAELVHQFQASDKCRGLFLESFMLKPVQRIPSYRLLLKDYLKHLPPDSDEFTDVKVALDTVSEVATHINESMKKSDNFERVLRIQESIGGNAEIVKPGREFIKEGTLQKLCRKDMQERTFFLLTDVLLYTSAVGGGQYKLKGTFPLLGLKVALPDSPEFENEFSVISKSRSFTLSASTQAERDEWIQQITDAISALAKKRGTFMISKDGAVAAPPEGEEDEGKLGEKAPVWIQDTRVTMCMLCTDRFTVTNRRHHCRGCGKVVCGSCSDNLAPLAYLDYEQARVCEVCYEVLLKEQNKSIPVTETDHPPPSPVGIGGDDLDRINRKPPKFEILHRFKPGSKKHNRRSRLFTSKSSVRTEVVGHDSESQMSGYLRFKRTNRHGWKRLWFVLKDNVLYTYKASEDVVAMETIPILGYVVQEATRTEGDEIQFQLKHAGLPPISFKTETESSAFRWTQELRKATTL